MKVKALVMVLSLVGMTTSVFSKDCQPSADDLVEILETEVDSYDQFIYGRYLESEEGLCRRVTTGLSRLRRSFNEELYVPLSAAVHQLFTLRATAKGTDAGPCVERMTDILERETKEENGRFQQCLDVPAAQLEGLESDLLRDTKKYADLKIRSKEAIKSCLVNLPSTCLNTTTGCMDTQTAYFNDVAKSLTDTRIIRSPCMVKFVDALDCFSKSVENFIRKARLVHRKTIACISFEDNNSTRQSILAFATNLVVNSTLLEQVKNSQRKFEDLNKNVVETLGRYYRLEKSAKMTYKLQPHDWEHFKERLDAEFAGQLRSVEEVRSRKRHVWPEHMADGCCDQAISDIGSIINSSAYSFEKCERELLEQTQVLIKVVRNELGEITKELTQMGDNAIMDCLNGGAVLAENAVEGCYDLRLRQFRLDKQDALERVDKLMTVLERYNATYFDDSQSTRSLCGDTFLSRAEWSVDKILFELSRCSYKWVVKDRTAAPTVELPPIVVQEDWYYPHGHQWKPITTTDEPYEITDEPE